MALVVALLACGAARAECTTEIAGQKVAILAELMPALIQTNPAAAQRIDAEVVPMLQLNTVNDAICERLDALIVIAREG
ncbi:hypothetical protein [Plastoroseomonas arctica]|uniref:Uncharacterized protein n=1 Tax=Plastoroseomonas arctica TaxID=1509237 RepID=A0AAF1KT73_9PROT|nr:hypothetical protein [Plastoroseomonas arctica]MBR0655062.1 hypothetical protein [Plastoroseomonas arctica]